MLQQLQHYGMQHLPRQRHGLQLQRVVLMRLHRVLLLLVGDVLALPRDRARSEAPAEAVVPAAVVAAADSNVEVDAGGNRRR